MRRTLLQCQGDADDDSWAQLPGRPVERDRVRVHPLLPDINQGQGEGVQQSVGEQEPTLQELHRESSCWTLPNNDCAGTRAPKLCSSSHSCGKGACGYAGEML